MDALYGTEEHLGRMAVQGTGGFIGQEQLRFVDDRPGAGVALFLAAGHLIGIFVQNIRDAEGLRHLQHFCVNLFCRRVIDGQGQRNIFGNSERVQKVEVLKDKAEIFPAESGQRMIPDFCDIRPVQADMAGADRINRGDAVQQRCLDRKSVV